MPDLSQVLQGLILAGILALVGFAFRHSERLTRVETVLRGEDGTNGLNGRVRSVESKQDRLQRQVDQQAVDIGRIQERIA